MNKDKKDYSFWVFIQALFSVILSFLFIIGLPYFIGYNKFPSGCEKYYPSNSTISGFVMANFNECYAHIYTGYDPNEKFFFSKGANTYENIHWKRDEE